MRRGLAKLASPPPAASAATLSTFSGAGGSGRGRGRGASIPPSSPVPGQPSSDATEEDPFLSVLSRGRGGGLGGGADSSSPIVPSLSSFLPSSLGRGRGITSPSPSATPPQNPNSTPKTPLFFARDDSLSPKTDSPSSFSGSGRGKPTNIPTPTESDPKPGEENRHLRRREENAKRAMEVLSRGGSGSDSRGRGGPSTGGRGMQGRGRGRGRGQAAGRGAKEEEDDDLAWFVGDNAYEERARALGEEKMKVLNDAFEQAALSALPTPLEDAYKDAVHVNNMIECEEEYLVGFGNPDIEEKPPMSLEEVLETAKPFLVAYEGFRSQEEWEVVVKDVMERLPKMKEMMEVYCGPDRVTAKQQQEELQRVASTLPAKAPPSVKNFTDRVLLSLQSNPGWGFDKKCQFMDKLAWEVNQHYK